MKVGFCGLGQMGAPMASHVIEAGHDVKVWNRTADKAKELAAAGAEVADTPADAARAAEVVITMLATPGAVEEVIFGEDGIASGINEGTVLVEMSTIGPAALARIAERMPAGVEVVDAPVLGSAPQAEEGTLRVFVGSSQVLFEELSPLLRAFGDPLHIGPAGSAAAVKLVVNSTLGGIQVALGEALLLADALGLDASTVLDVLELSPLGATVKKKRDKIESGVFEPHFKLGLMLKDMSLVIDEARRVGVDLPGATVACDAYAAAVDQGLDTCDYSALAAFLSGREASPS